MLALLARLLLASILDAIRNVCGAPLDTGADVREAVAKGLAYTAGSSVHCLAEAVGGCAYNPANRVCQAADRIAERYSGGLSGAGDARVLVLVSVYSELRGGFGGGGNNQFRMY